MDYEYDDEYDDQARFGRVRWGRIALLVVALAGVFVLGRWTVDAGAADDELEALEAERDALQQEVADLEAELEATRAGGADEPDEADDSADEPDDEADDDGADAEADESEQAQDDESEQAQDDAADGDDGARQHEVQASETLYTIAEQYYGDGAEFTLIAEANNLSRDDPLRVGQVLEIPPEG